MTLTATDTVIQTAGLTKVFRDFWLRAKVTAVSELNMSIHRHEVFGLLGPNGSGKSTTIKMILGLLFPTKGTISVFGQHPSNVKVKRRIGFLPEESHLYPFLDARETLDYYGRLFQLPRAERLRRIDMLLDMVGLSRVAYRRVGEYSKGMQRRIGLAQALINDPDLLILDEPTSGLDPLGTRQFKDLIRTLADRGKTVVLSSHLLGDVEDVCDRVSVLYGGQKQQEGKVDELLARKDYTQLTTDTLDDATLEKIRALLAEKDKNVLEVTHPHDRLESLFLRIVEQAQKKKLDTGGAQAGGHVAEFLQQASAEQGQEVIESLVAEAQPQPEPQPEPEAEVLRKLEVQQQEDVLSELQSETTPPPLSSESPADQQAESSAAQADRSIIEGLLGGDEDKHEGQQ